MRQIGSLSQRTDAVRFASYLVTRGISAHAEEDHGEWVIWVREEDQIPDAKSALSEFVTDPSNTRYHDAERTAVARRREESVKRDAARQNTVSMRDRWGATRSARHRPLTIAIVLLCGALAVASEMGRDERNQVLRALLFADPKHYDDGDWQGNTLSEKLIDIRRGELWRMFTPAFLHGNAMHLLFNMVIFYQLGSVVEQRRGTWRLGVLILVIGVISNLAQALVPSAWGGTTQFLGLSGVVYGLLGYAWMAGRYQPQLGIFVSQSTIVLALVLLVLGITGQLGITGSLGVANWAHGVGFLVGYVIGLAPVMWRPKS